jgi:hypothetical protein
LGAGDGDAIAPGDAGAAGVAIVLGVVIVLGVAIAPGVRIGFGDCIVDGCFLRWCRFLARCFVVAPGLIVALLRIVDGAVVLCG